MKKQGEAIKDTVDRAMSHMEDYINELEEKIDSLEIEIEEWQEKNSDLKEERDGLLTKCETLEGLIEKM